MKIVKCKICSRECNGFLGLGMHIHGSHSISSKQYYDEYLKKDHEGKCLSCNRETRFRSFSDGYFRFCAKCGCKQAPKIAWSRGLTKETNASIARSAQIRAGVTRTKIVREKMSKAKLGITQSKVAREKRSIGMINFIIQNNGVNPGAITFFHGWFYSNKNKKKISYDSSWELIAFKILELMSQVQSYDRCKYVLSYKSESSLIKNYLPDILVKYVNGIEEIIEIKPLYKLKDFNTKSKFKAGKNYAKQHNLKYSVWTEKHLGIEKSAVCLTTM